MPTTAAAPTTCTPSSTSTGCPPTTPCTSRRRTATSRTSSSPPRATRPRIAGPPPPQTAPTIGDRLSAKGVDWAWYSGGWSNANGDVGAPGWTNGTGPTCSDPDTIAGATFPNCPDKLFQFHHQPLNYFASFAPGTAKRRQHLRDEREFVRL